MTTAPEYVEKMEISSERREVALVLAGRFDKKSFLPTCADIRDFCETYGVEVPASKSRAGAIPRIFKFLATMDTGELQRLLDEEAFSGPVRLGPIAEAIRQHGRATRRRGDSSERKKSEDGGDETFLRQ